MWCRNIWHFLLHPISTHVFSSEKCLLRYLSILKHNHSFAMHRSLSLMQPCLPAFAYISCIFDFLSEGSTCKEMSWRTLPVRFVSFWLFQGLSLTFKLLFPLKFVLHGQWITFHFSPPSSSPDSTHWKEHPSPSECVENHMAANSADRFLHAPSVPFFCVFILLPA